MWQDSFEKGRHLSILRSGTETVAGFFGFGWRSGGGDVVGQKWEYILPASLGDTADREVVLLVGGDIILAPFALPKRICGIDDVVDFVAFQVGLAEVERDLRVAVFGRFKDCAGQSADEVD